MSGNHKYSNKYRTPLFRAAFFRAIEPEVNANPDGTSTTNWCLTAIMPEGSDISPIGRASFFL